VAKLSGSIGHAVSEGECCRVAALAILLEGSLRAAACSSVKCATPKYIRRSVLLGCNDPHALSFGSLGRLSWQVGCTILV
jgi:hypothetical protein